MLLNIKTTYQSFYWKGSCGLFNWDGEGLETISDMLRLLLSTVKYFKKYPPNPISAQTSFAWAKEVLHCLVQSSEEPSPMKCEDASSGLVALRLRYFRLL